MLDSKKIADLLPFSLLAALILYEIYKGLISILESFNPRILVFVVPTIVIFILFRAGLLRIFSSKRIDDGFKPGEFLLTRDKILIQTKGSRILVKALELTSPQNSELELKFSQIAEVLAHMGINSSLAVMCFPKKHREDWIDFKGDVSDEEGFEVFQRRTILLWVEVKENESLKMAKSMLDRAESTIKSKLGDEWDIEVFKGSNLKELSKTLLFRLQIALFNLDFHGETPKSLVDSIYLEIGRRSNGSLVKLSLRDLCHHITILGRTGSGKTTTSKFLVSKIWELGVPVLIFDYESEYRDLVLTLGGKVISPSLKDDIVAVNVLGDLNDVSEAKLDEIAEQFTIILDLTPPQTYLLLKALVHLSEQAREGDSPTLVDLYEEIASLKAVGEAEQESKRALLRKFYPFIKGEARRVLCEENFPKIEDLMSDLISIELRDIATESVREIFVFTILRRIYHYNKTKGRTSGIRHITVLEEAERILPKIADLTGLTIGDRMVSELRKYGEGIIVISQSPSNLSPHIIRNASTKIIHALGSTQDVSFIHSLLGPSLKAVGEISHQIHYLKTGECLVALRNSAELSRVRIKPEYIPPELEEEDLRYLISTAPKFYHKRKKEVLKSRLP